MNKVIIRGLEEAIEMNARALTELLESKDYYVANDYEISFYRQYADTLEALYTLKALSEVIYVENLTHFKNFMTTIEKITQGYYEVEWGDKYIIVDIS